MRSGANFPINFKYNYIFNYINLAVFILLIFSIDFLFDQQDFYQVFALYTLSFLSLFFIFTSNLSLKVVIIAGLCTRCSLIFLFPGFSDDIYRFFWDGRLIIEGISPYGILPVQAAQMGLKHLDSHLLQLLNSPNYYTIYPPVNQLYFAISSLTGDLQSSVVVMKILVIITEMIGLWYLLKIIVRNQINTRIVILYYLNPLIILECIGNLHFEMVMLSFMIIAIYEIFTSRYVTGALFLSLGIGVKLLPLMILPFFIFRIPKAYRISFFSSLLIFLTIIFSPLLYGFATSHFLDSVDLYFRKFEFNASIYYILRYVGQLWLGYNLIHYIGPILALCTMLYNIYLANKSKEYSETLFWSYCLVVWTTYLMLSTTVHPWYISSLVIFSILSYKFYPIIWSYLVIISYNNYSDGLYYENLWFIAIEYALLWIFMYMEYKRHHAEYQGPMLSPQDNGSQ